MKKVSDSQPASGIDWTALRRLRARFLEFEERPGGAGGDYWTSEKELASYDATFAERIGWKWDAVLGELAARGWQPPVGRVVDWGCGTGVAGRRVLAAFPEACRELVLWDHSPRARRYALERARERFPAHAIRLGEADEGGGLLLISHVLNELNRAALEKLLAVVKTAEAVLWVEPGTAGTSRELVAVRERLLEHFRPIGPCPHAGRCGLLAPENETHWCHHFARPPGWVHQDGEWARFGKLLEIDVTTVPFSWLALDRRPMTGEEGTHRIIGRPRHYKGFQKLLCCGAEGVRERMLQKRDAPALFKEMKKDPGSLYRVVREGEKIVSGERVGAPRES